MANNAPASVVDGSPPVGHARVEPASVMVVDDSAFDRQVIGRLLMSMSGIKVIFAKSGSEGLALIEHESPAVIITDLIMPDMEGLELVQRVRAQHPHISVILATAFGSEEVAMQALRAGAANYIPKKRLSRDLVPIIRQVLSIADTTRERRRILRSMVRRESAYVLENDPELILALLKILREEIEGLNMCDPCGQLQLGVALQEALCNALYHGNLEVSSDLRQEDERVFEALAAQRMTQEPYRSRRIRVQIQLDREACRFVIADDGPGFDTTIFDRPSQPEDVNRIGGRGLLLIRAFMDQTNFNPSGNQISMVKYRTLA